MGFHEIRFPANLSFGSLGGPERRTEVVTLTNGHEERNSPWAQSRRRYDAGLGLRRLDDVEALIAFFEARRGRLHGFRWKDWADYRSAPASRPVTATDQLLGMGDGVQRAFALRKGYRSGAQVEWRAITKPVADTVMVALGADLMADGKGWALDATTGVIRFDTPPGKGAEVRAGFEFDVPVRFDTDLIQVSVASFRAGDLPRVPVVEIRA
ncbi:DUF2460 domain-containing protein [Rhodobacteraceae bacterium 2376]|uniref:DUF2460 domain-containing protein n=1 Tax=Rhabdonatronobacter sediminivivens TaxID=2743469 RepID=A0A7Z0KW85_9RHOB|nr:DUF2460 domain-containing protein [Rhabdonatronobacter sediminivivens]NYS23962.1 DUF2460 domain-containing protein [Rhabdonatronobacter sediminivivens]